MAPARAFLIWAGLTVAVVLPFAIAATSPLLAWRDAVYIVAGFAGIAAMGLLLVQPLLAGGALPRLEGLRGRRVHKWTGAVLVGAILAHVGGLWITSPPDVIDALLFRSPTPFSVWGVVAMWALFAAASLALWRGRLRMRPRTWRFSHKVLVVVAAVTSVVHALLIEGTMETVSKVVLCLLVLAALATVIVPRRGRATRDPSRL